MTQSLRTIREYLLKNYDMAIIVIVICTTFA
jgi:hypothetical protein